MNDNFLSQDEIDALLGNKEPIEEEESNLEDLNETERDIMGEVGNISMSTAATTLSSLLNKKVLITTPRVSWIPFEQIIQECDVPKVVANIKYKSGLSGINLLMMDVVDAVIIADLMMDGDGEGISPKEELSELELSAVAEAMNQMIGSASTAMATMLERGVDIFPPDVSLWNEESKGDFKDINMENYVCKIAFDLTVEGLIDSQIMQIFSRETVNEIIDIMMGDAGGPHSDTEESHSDEGSPSIAKNEEVQEESPAEEPITREEPMTASTKGQTVSEEPIKEQPEKAGEDSTEKVSVQKPVFPTFEKTKEDKKAPRNLDLIMDVPLEFSVVLGKTRRTIKDILSFRNGSIIELDKLADEPLEIYVNGKLIAQGEVVVINENFGIRITNILSKEQRVQNFK